MNIDRTKNPTVAQLSTKDIDITNLQPQTYRLDNGIQLDVFPSAAVEVMRLDFVFEAGKAYAENPLTAIAAMALITEGTARHSAKEIADFLNFRGITMERTLDGLNTCFTIYLQNKYMNDFLPLLKEIFTQPAFAEDEFDIYLTKKQQEFENQLKKTSYQASVTCIKELFGNQGPFSKYLAASDFGNITTNDVSAFYQKYYNWQNCKIFAAGNLNPNHINAVNHNFGTLEIAPSPSPIEPQTAINQPIKKHIDMAGAVQTSIRIGKIIPCRWDSMEFAKLMVVNNLLGGYFGSRLMMNVREDKGYCYGIYSMMQVERNAIYMIISSEVGTDVAQAAITEIFNEIQRLQTDPVPDDELQRSKNYLVGDFLRSVDGVYELLERDRTLHTTHSDNTFTKNLLRAIDETIATDVIALARKYFATDSFTQITAG